MAGREQPYDPYIPAGGAPGAGNSAPDGGNQRTAALQAVSYKLAKHQSTIGTGRLVCSCGAKWPADSSSL